MGVPALTKKVPESQNLHGIFVASNKFTSCTVFQTSVFCVWGEGGGRFFCVVSSIAVHSSSGQTAVRTAHTHRAVARRGRGGCLVARVVGLRVGIVCLRDTEPRADAATMKEMATRQRDQPLPVLERAEADGALASPFRRRERGVRSGNPRPRSTARCRSITTAVPENHRPPPRPPPVPSRHAPTPSRAQRWHWARPR